MYNPQKSRNVTKKSVKLNNGTQISRNRFSFPRNFEDFRNRLCRMPGIFWVQLIALFGVADFLTWSVWADIDRNQRFVVTIGVVGFAFMVTFVNILFQPTEDENLVYARNLTRFAREQFNKKNYSEAEKLLRVAIIIDPNSLAANSLFGRTLVRMGKWSESLEYQTYAIRNTQVDDNRQILLNSRGIAYMMLGNYSYALQDFDASLLLFPESNITRYFRALTWFYLEQYDNMLVESDYVLKRKPDDFCTHATRALAFHGLQDESESLVELSVCERLVSDKAIHFYYFSLMYSLRNNFSEAIRNLQTAIKMNEQYRYRAIDEPILEKLHSTREFNELLC